MEEQPQLGHCEHTFLQLFLKPLRATLSGTAPLFIDHIKAHSNHPGLLPLVNYNADALVNVVSIFEKVR